jgi:hypothetical protein
MDEVHKPITTKHMRKLFVNPLHLPVEKVRLSEDVKCKHKMAMKLGLSSKWTNVS